MGKRVLPNTIKVFPIEDEDGGTQILPELPLGMNVCATL